MGKTDLRSLLKNLAPRLADGTFVFCSVPGGAYGDHAALQPLGAFAEAEGLTLILSREQAVSAKLPFEGEFAMISLGVFSSLSAVGLTAAVSTALAEHGISANVVAAFHHDHVFVPVERADEALDVLFRAGARRAVHD